MELSSYPILRGVIILIFNKALEEPKYSSMYAQLCKRLNEEVPHFVKDNKQCSFNLLLLNKCGDEFSKRRENLEQLGNTGDHHPDSLLDEEERRHLAKRKMLGNIKFMGELGKLEILSGHLLHKCIQELLYTASGLVRLGEDPAEDLECLCQIMRTSGRLLDSEESQPLVNQYFKRLNQLASKPTLPPRIRFMLKDIIDLRANNWMPRKATLVEGPMPIQQIRSPDDDHHHHHHHHHMLGMGSGNNSGNNGNNHHRLAGGNGGGNAMGHGRDSHSGGGGGGRDGGGSGGGYGRDGGYRGGNGGHRGGDRGGDHHRGDHRDNRGHGGDGHMDHRDRGGGSELFRHPMKTRGGIIEEMFKGMSMNNSTNSGGGFSSSNGYNSGNSGTNRGGDRGGDGAGQTQRERDNANTTFNTRSQRSSTSGGGGSNYGSSGQNQNRGQYKHNTGGGGGGGGSGGGGGASGGGNGGGVGGGQNAQYNNQSNKELAPRFKKSLIVRDLNLGDVELRPSINPGAFNKAATMKLNNQMNSPTTRSIHDTSSNSLNSAASIVTVTKTTVGTATLGSITTGNSISPLLMHSKDPLPIKTAAADKQAKKNQKDKGVNREDLVKRFGQLVHRLTLDEMNLQEAIAEIKELKIPEKFNRDILKTTFQTEVTPKFVQLVGALRRDGLLTGNHMQEVLKSACAQLNDEAENEVGKMAQVLSAAVQEQLLSIAEIGGNITENGAHYPLFWLLLQDLHKSIGKTDLDRLFKESKVNLLSQLGSPNSTNLVVNSTDPAITTTTNGGRELGEELEARGLAHLCPLLRVQAQLAKQLQADPGAHNLYRWINENLDAVNHTDPGFINALVTVLLQYISQEAALGSNDTQPTDTTTAAPPTDTTSSTTTTPEKHIPTTITSHSSSSSSIVAPPTSDRDKAITERERGLLHKYKGVLQKFLDEQPALQLTALYAVQVYFHQLGFPRGQLLRWFNALYDLNVIDEEAFFSWKENVTDVYPGKGNALFQVNSWLTWLEESEYEEEEGEE